MARVELIDAGPDDYTALDAEMKRASFTRDLGVGNGERFVLPTGTYAFVGGLPTARVLALVRSAVATTKREGAIVIVEAKGAAWDGLKKR